MNEEITEKEYGLNRGNLKMIALFCMTLDHVAIAFIESSLKFMLANSVKYYVLLGLDLVLRMVGRLAFPIYCFFIVEGYDHTRSKFKYALRLLILALISEVPFDLVAGQKLLYLEYQNIFSTLFISLIAVWEIDTVGKKVKNKVASVALETIIATAAMLLAHVLKVDYGAPGVLTVIAIYLAGKNRIGYIIVLNIIGQGIKFFGNPGHTAARFGMAIVFLFIYSIAIYSAKKMVNESVRKSFVSFSTLSTLNWFEIPTVFDSLILAFYNGKKGKGNKWFFYFYYPAHLLVLAGICKLLKIF